MVGRSPVLFYRFTSSDSDLPDDAVVRIALYIRSRHIRSTCVVCTKFISQLVAGKTGQT